MRNIKKSIILSTIIHAILIMLLLVPLLLSGQEGNGDDQEGPNKDRSKEDGKQIQDKMTPKVELYQEVLIVEIDKDGPPLKKTIVVPKNNPADVKCLSDYFYGGLGINTTMRSSQYCLITSVAHGYVGEQIGLEGGDVIVSPSCNDIKGEVGTEITVQFQKPNGNIVTVTTLRDKICVF